MTPPSTGTALRITWVELTQMLVEIVVQTCRGQEITKLEAREIFDRFRVLFGRLGAFDLGSYDG